jgi:hypothetical protein
MLLAPAVVPHDGGVQQWTGAETCQLVITSSLWLVCVTAPATTFIVVGVQQVGALPLFVPASLVITAVCALGGGLIAIPFTHVLGRLLIWVRGRLTPAVAHALLAGALATVCVEVIVLVQGEDPIWPLSLVASAPAGIAAAIARWRLGVVEPATTPGAETPALAEDPAAWWSRSTGGIGR